MWKLDILQYTTRRCKTVNTTRVYFKKNRYCSGKSITNIRLSFFGMNKNIKCFKMLQKLADDGYQNGWVIRSFQLAIKASHSQFFKWKEKRRSDFCPPLNSLCINFEFKFKLVCSAKFRLVWLAQLLERQRAILSSSPESRGCPRKFTRKQSSKFVEFARLVVLSSEFPSLSMVNVTSWCM